MDLSATHARLNDLTVKKQLANVKESKNEEEKEKTTGTNKEAKPLRDIEDVEPSYNMFKY